MSPKEDELKDFTLRVRFIEGLDPVRNSLYLTHIGDDGWVTAINKAAFETLSEGQKKFTIWRLARHYMEEHDTDHGLMPSAGGKGLAPANRVIMGEGAVPSQVTYTDGACVMLAGDPVQGFSAYGPFANQPECRHKAYMAQWDEGKDWWMLPLRSEDSL